MDTKELARIIAGGESQTVEFKESFGEEALETLAAFANTSGGTLLIGVADNGRVTGAHTGKETLRAWANRVTQATSLNPDIREVQVGGKHIISFSVEESPVKPVACAGRYFKRINNSNRRMTDDDITRIVLKKVGVTWDEVEEPRAKLADIDNGALAAFRAVWVSFPSFRAADTKVGDRVGDRVGENLSLRQEAILKILAKEKYITAREVAMEIGISTRKTEKNIARLREKGLLKRVGPVRGGHWEVALKGLPVEDKG